MITIPSGGAPAFAGDRMEQTAAFRAQWLAQLADAIESAQCLAWQLGAQERTSAEARRLYGRLEEVRMELESIRGLVGAKSWRMEPDWLQMLGWAPIRELPPD